MWMAKKIATLLLVNFRLGSPISSVRTAISTASSETIEFVPDSNLLIA